MPTLASSGRTRWDKNKYSKVEFDYPRGVVGTGQVSVKQDGPATSKTVPGSVDLVKSEDGSLANHTDATINYTLRA
jgi:hypothetical protein